MGRGYISFPKNKPGIIDECCSCPTTEQIPTKGSVDIKLEMGTPVSIIKHWCANCGLYFSTKDQDRYFPAPFWVDNRPVEPRVIGDKDG